MNDVPRLYVWFENEASRGTDEIISCLRNLWIIYHTKYIFVQYSESWVGQNNNFAAISFLVFLVHSGCFDAVQHEFLVTGHMPCGHYLN